MENMKILRAGDGKTTFNDLQVNFSLQHKIKTTLIVLFIPFHIHCATFKRILQILDYTNWEGGIDNPPIGCKTSGCGIYDGIVGRPDAKMTWNAHDKSSALPFICLSKCRFGYKWYDGK